MGDGSFGLLTQTKKKSNSAEGLDRITHFLSSIF